MWAGMKRKQWWWLITARLLVLPLGLAGCHIPLRDAIYLSGVLPAQ